MRKIMFLLMLIASTVVFIIGCQNRTETECVKVYVVDAQMMQLIPVSTYIPKCDGEEKAKRLIKVLIKGFDENPKIRRLIPDIPNCMSVEVVDRCAVVDIKNKMLENHPDGRSLEKLTVYSIVNTLTEVEGIDCVRFTVNGEVTKKFMGYMDMKQVFRKNTLM
ncbi:MAG: GerMN domain-containing protein [Clostridia bacterium]|nr:GerMN domain-containing protein [Clostridia bacterium]